jgi:hypothetical protein
MSEKVVNLHTFYMHCAECGDFAWLIQMENDLKDIAGIQCANQECCSFVENPNLNIEVELEEDE